MTAKLLIVLAIFSLILITGCANCVYTEQNSVTKELMNKMIGTNNDIIDIANKCLSTRIQHQTQLLIYEKKDSCELNEGNSISKIEANKLLEQGNTYIDLINVNCNYETKLPRYPDFLT